MPPFCRKDAGVGCTPIILSFSVRRWVITRCYTLSDVISITLISRVTARYYTLSHVNTCYHPLIHFSHVISIILISRVTNHYYTLTHVISITLLSRLLRVIAHYCTFSDLDKPWNLVIYASKYGNILFEGWTWALIKD